MAREYFYFLAGLPTLQWEQTPPLRLEELLQEARRLCDPQDAAALERVLAAASFNEDQGEAHDPAWVRRWRDFLRAWRRALVQVRAGLSNREVRDEIDLEAPVDPWAVEAAAQAAQAPNPLAAEIVLMRFLWTWLDEEESRVGLFSRERVWIYGLKLYVLQRLADMSDERASSIWDVHEQEALSVLH